MDSRNIIFYIKREEADSGNSSLSKKSIITISWSYNWEQFIFFIYMRNLFLHFYCSGQCVASGGGMVFMMRKEPAPDGLAL